PWSDPPAHRDEGEQQEEIDGGDRERAPAPARKPTLDPAHDGKDEVREEERENEKEERRSQEVDEAEARRDHEHGPRRARRAGPEEEHPADSVPRARPMIGRERTRGEARPRSRETGRLRRGR